MKKSPTRTGWSELFEFLASYWKAYGGIRKLVVSPYIHLSVLLCLACWNLWNEPGWWELAISIQPSILGFTLGGFAILLASATDRFGAILAHARRHNEDTLDSPLAKLAAAFVHFIIVQFASLVFALIAKAAYMKPAPEWAPFLADCRFRLSMWAVGFLLFVYALACAVATTEWVLRTIRTLIKYHKKVNKLGLK